MRVESAATASKRPGSSELLRARQQEASPDACATLQPSMELLTAGEWAARQRAVLQMKDKSYRRYPVGQDVGQFMRKLRVDRCSQNTLDAYETVLRQADARPHGLREARRVLWPGRVRPARRLPRPPLGRLEGRHVGPTLRDRPLVLRVGGREWEGPFQPGPHDQSPTRQPPATGGARAGGDPDDRQPPAEDRRPGCDLGVRTQRATQDGDGQAAGPRHRPRQRPALPPRPDERRHDRPRFRSPIPTSARH